MKLILSLIIIASCYYSFSYGVYLWKTEKNKIAGFGVLFITLLGVIVPMVNMYINV